MAAFVVLARQALANGSKGDFFRHPSLDMCKVQHNADALQEAAGSFGDLQPDWRPVPYTNLTLPTNDPVATAVVALT